METIKPNGININVTPKGTITVVCGDTDFQDTLTDREREYIHEGCNWISKLGRETHLKSLHLIGFTLDKLEALPEKERKETLGRAQYEWRKQWL